MKRISTIIILLFLPYIMEATCPTTIAIKGGQLELQWATPGDRPVGLTNIDHDGTNYTGGNQGATKWVTDADTFTSADVQGFHTLVISGETCYYQDGAVPVELVSFTAEQAGVKLTWITATETNNHGFDIERSLDGKIFKKIGFVGGHGTITVPMKYTFIDDEEKFTGTYFYRLKQIDYNGNFTYSPIIEIYIQNDEREKFSVLSPYSNPAKEYVMFDISVPKDANVSCKIYSLYGPMAYNYSEKLSPGNHTLTIQLKDFSSGIYVWNISSGLKSFSGKLIVTK